MDPELFPPERGPFYNPCDPEGEAPPVSQATAVGIDSQAIATGAVALGYGAAARADFATAIGQESNAAGFSSVAVGSRAQAEGPYSIAIGTGPTEFYEGGAGTFGVRSFAAGNGARADGDQAIALGAISFASADSIAAGFFAQALGLRSTAFGRTAHASICVRWLWAAIPTPSANMPSPSGRALWPGAGRPCSTVRGSR